ncbi:putative DNA binding domain-containing protein, partial [Desulfosarcina sp. OttesenSCG-928-A07]|nr:putative DNA binding domain-containing protein [Desulfosarcina sp. OttesenSCG-928-A07]
MTAKRHENETVEFKKTLGQLKEGIISISAILNKHGEGELWFGIRDDGIPVGINVGAKTIRDISQAIAAHIDPKIYPEITTHGVDGMQCIKVVFSGQDAPYSAYGRPYIRVGDADRRLSAQELQHFIVRKQRAVLRWDSEPGKAPLADMDIKKVRAFVERAGLKWHSLHSAMENLGLLVEDKLVNTAPLFFSKKPALKLRCAVFGTDTTSFIIDRQDFDGNILELIEEAQKYILKNIYIGMRLEGLYRVDVPEIAIPAIREAIINAFCHRDYRDPEYVQVAVFKNRVEIRNPGTLFGGITIESLRHGKLSRRRNPLIAQLL